MGQSILQNIMPGMATNAAPSGNFQGPMNPIQQFNSFMQAMTNPAAYLKQKFPDIPDEIQNDPNQILAYLQKTRGISNEDVQKTIGSMPQGMPWNGGR